MAALTIICSLSPKISVSNTSFGFGTQIMMWNHCFCLHTAGCWWKAPIKSKPLFYMLGFHSEVSCHPKARVAAGCAMQFWGMKLFHIWYVDTKTTLVAQVHKGGILCHHWGLSPCMSRWSLLITGQLQLALLVIICLLDFNLSLACWKGN